MRPRPSSVRARLTLWYTLVLSLPLVGFAVVSYVIFSRTLRARTDAFIGDALNVFALELMSERRIRSSIDESVRSTAREVRFRELDIIVLDDSNAVVAISGAGDTAGRPEFAPTDSSVVAAIVATDQTKEVVSTVGRGGYRHRLVVRSLPLDNRRFRVAGLYRLADVERTLQQIRELFLVVIPLLAAFAATGGWFLAKRSLAPVSLMAARAAEIGASTLHERLPIAAEDELGTLARVLNDLLDRLERSFAQQRRFMADASHELRTPAAILRTEADVTLSRDHRSEAEYRESMGVVQDAARRLTRIVDDIFLLARADAGHLVMHSAPLYLEDLVQETVRAIRPIAARRGVRVDFGEAVEAPFQGDADLLGRVVLNLLDNAIKHSPPEATVHVRMAAPDGRYEVLVVDSGSGIPPDAQERVFERFFRVDSARSRAESSMTSGAGLGLAIGRRISEMHGGRLELVSSRPGRTEFRLVLPARPNPVQSSKERDD